MVFLSFLRRRYGDDFLRRLAAQKLRLVTSLSPGGEQVAAGEAAIQFPSGEYVAVNLKKRGAPIEISVPNSTTGIEPLIGAVAGDSHANADLLFVDFALPRKSKLLATAARRARPACPPQW